MKTKLGLFANDIIIIGPVRADWPAHFNVTIGNPRADKLGRNEMASNVSDGAVKLTESIKLCSKTSRVDNAKSVHSRTKTSVFVRTAQGLSSNQNEAAINSKSDL